MIPLHCPEGKTFGQEGKVVLDVLTSGAITSPWTGRSMCSFTTWVTGNGKYNAVDSNTFPLGVIYDGSNYHCYPEGDGWVIVR